ncbi:MAG: hypothetical protein IJW44_00020 [Clostridia bacterium]|nr:hypothetical protein [Clostridia bacterium]
MSYKSDMEFLKRDQEKPRKIALLLLKITVIALAVMILITAVAAPVVWFLENRDTGSSGDGDGEGGGSSSSGFRITGKNGSTVTVYLGDPISYKQYVTVSGASGDYELNVDRSQVKTDTAGSYKVIYTATDAKNKKASFTLTLIIKDGSAVYTQERLMNLIAAKVEELGIKESDTKTQQVKKIYDFVNAFSWQASGSNTPSQQSSRDGWENAWVEEAIRTLSKKAGDCFSYYSVSRAFFEYLEIENLSIKRATDQDAAHGTHFWNVVKVESGWYYYDATRLKGTFTSDNTRNGCLMTENKMNSYRPSDASSTLQMYKFDKWEGFPTIATEPIS